MKTENSQLENDLQKIIEILRQEFVMLYYKEGSFVHPTVLQMSQQLDDYIVAIQKLSLTKLTEVNDR
ncbi:aspartyl-phosphate phosphatase Spo0E family protein [Brevibacillus laterosporus]|uniref:aspartyl-phosphate phosphatase Spo0E family protein n=1 Tax=Brevibacillus laterosporus TaxID=1465 RepID=UPI0003689216|nr:aspartyl-phosphate phosphatase Spo0E family protein [Brevibacillus laterosporus]ATO51784.1 sporulation protein Spo0E [Brevibacillus laterosporus DSM 25]AYB37900.1 aspartyl-phosphate phosphatase Spo0E family protein [Brevibacillus laterosporus]MBG9802227.1 sporulation protein Spo0E [Brevibacillus laterosporus]MBM7109434.1 Spo0E like sporulation regulatory protein [Brevibacillus laterosporus]MED2006201.1 aspartyl-phosphate phosphatase Spo0E family protein [Brevibacillus laterosporus]